MTEPPKRAGMVRLDPAVREAIDRYAADHGITYNAAMNILVRLGLKAERQPIPPRTTTRKGPRQ